jgi:putative NADH-flavin reductase
VKLTIIAATGGIGRQLLEQAVAAGHDVTAVARNPQNLPATPARVVTADLAAADAAAFQPAVAGADAVLSALGARTRADAGVAARGTRVIVESMRASGVRRLIVVSAAPIGTVPSPGRPHPPRHDPGDGFVIRYLADPIVKRALRAHYADLAEMEDVLRDSDLDWTAVRPPRLTGKPVTGRYRTAYGQNIRGGIFVSRADVAHFMLRALDQPETCRQTVGIANSTVRLPEVIFAEASAR